MKKNEYSTYHQEPSEYPYDKGMVGSVWKLKVPVLGNPAGTIGYCFNEYADFDDPDALGVQVIFKNGNYDGFSIREQKDFLEFLNFNIYYADYKFTNVIDVQKDFDRGYWRW